MEGSYRAFEIGSEGQPLMGRPGDKGVMHFVDDCGVLGYAGRDRELRGGTKNIRIPLQRIDDRYLVSTT